MSHPNGTTTITLKVSTNLINQSNVNTYAQFTDNWNENETGNDPKDYVSKVDKDKDIVWKGAINTDPGQSSSGDTVQIVVVFKQPGTSDANDILNEDSYYLSNGTVTGKAKKSVSDTAIEPYLLVFSVTIFATQATTYYLIDPKLAINS